MVSPQLRPVAERADDMSESKCCSLGNLPWEMMFFGLSNGGMACGFWAPWGVFFTCGVVMMIAIVMARCRFWVITRHERQGEEH